MREMHHRFLFVLALLMAMAPIVAAQRPTDAPAHAPQGTASPAFGTSSDSVVNVGAYNFSIFEPGGGVSSGDGVAFRWMTAGTNKLFISSVQVPTGVTITGLGLYYCDTTTSGDFFVELLDFYGDQLVTGVNSFVAPDLSACGVSFAPATTYDFDSNSGHVLEIFIFQQGTAVGGQVKFKGAEVHYRRKISPDPSTATFADVPVGSTYHRFVEALVAAGITGGCGGGNYCPDAPVTRGQIAVFLSAALGLHWPN